MRLIHDQKRAVLLAERQQPFEKARIRQDLQELVITGSVNTAAIWPVFSARSTAARSLRARSVATWRRSAAGPGGRAAVVRLATGAAGDGRCHRPCRDSSLRRPGPGPPGDRARHPQGKAVRIRGGGGDLPVEGAEGLGQKRANLGHRLGRQHVGQAEVGLFPDGAGDGGANGRTCCRYRPGRNHPPRIRRCRSAAHRGPWPRPWGTARASPSIQCIGTRTGNARPGQPPPRGRGGARLGIAALFPWPEGGKSRGVKPRDQGNGRVHRPLCPGTCAKAKGAGASEGRRGQGRMTFPSGPSDHAPRGRHGSIPLAFSAAPHLNSSARPKIRSALRSPTSQSLRAISASSWPAPQPA